MSVLSTAPPPSAWINRFATLHPDFYTFLDPAPLPNPVWVAASPSCAESLGLDPKMFSKESDALGVFSGHLPSPIWSGMQPLASVYSGHQFGHWAGQLGDGRAHWLGELSGPSGSYELQLKGSGPTPYSRRGDGRAVLRSSIREFLCSEAMHALGVPTTRALCITGSPMPVYREKTETAAVVTRVARSFIRFGHFEHFTFNNPQPARLQELADFVIDHHFPACKEQPHPYAALLQEVVQQTARLMAQWQVLGFCHGVMNTDNMSILGLTLDYGPFAFMDAFDPGYICNHSDTGGRYAYDQQPQMGWWNLHVLAQAFMPLIEDKELVSNVLNPYPDLFKDHLLSQYRAKFGLHMPDVNDEMLVQEFLSLMARDSSDYTIVFRQLSRFNTTEKTSLSALRDFFISREAFDTWAQKYKIRLQQENSQDVERAQRMNQVNPKFIPRNYLCQQAIEKAESGDYSQTQRLLQVLQNPYDEQPENESYANYPPDWAQTLSLSCSS
jgi:serine/tyrosine/threonine adenylyltransferase